MIRRVVSVQFREDATPAQIEEYVRTVHGFARRIPQIENLSRGLHVTDGNQAVAFSHVALFDFATMDDLQAFLKHPVRLEAANGLFRQVISKRVIVNYEV